MKRPSGDLHIVDFKTGKVIHSLQAEDYLEDLRHWEIKNTVDILDVTILENSPYAPYLQQQNLILKEVRIGVIIPYVITEIEKDSEAGTLRVQASGEWILLDKEDYIIPRSFESLTAKEFMVIALNGTDWILGNIEATGTRSVVTTEFISPLQLLNMIAQLFDNYELNYRVQIQGAKVIRKYVDLVKRRGNKVAEKEITLGKDLQGIKRIENSENIITALIGFVPGQDKDGNDILITFEDINNGKPYIVDEDAFQRWNVNGKHRFGFYTPETEELEMTKERLLTLTRMELKKRSKTFVSYEVDAVDISTILGLEHEAINEGDTVYIKDEGLTPPLYLEARAIVGDESHKDTLRNKYTYGNYREIANQDEALRRLYQKLLAQIGDKVPKEMMEALENKVTETENKANQAIKESQTAKDLATATQKYMEQNMVDIIEQPTAPTENLRDGKTLWIDNSDPENKVQKLWKDGQWQRVTPDTGPLQQSIKDAENEINTLKETVKDLPDTTWVNQQLEGKADKSGVYTKEYIDQNVVGKQVYETDKQGNIQKFTDMKTEIDQNAEAITHKAEKTQVDTISDDLKQVTQTANTAKQTADSNTNTITELKTTVNNISVGSTNLASGSETGLNKQNMAGTWSESKQMTVSDKISYRNKTFTISFLFTGKMTKINTNPWFGVEAAITYADGEQEYNSIRTDTRLSLNVEYKDEPLSTTFSTKDKDVTQVKFYYSGRNIDGDLNSHHAKFEEGNIRTTWQPANEEVTSKADFTKITNEIKQTVDTNSQTITTLQKDQGTMQSTLNEVKQTTDSNSQTIKTLSQTQGKQGAIIQQNTSDITQLNNQIKSKVSDTQMQEYVGGLGSTNLLFNAAFEDRVINDSGVITSRTPSVTKWGIWVNGTNFKATPESARNHDGYNSVKLETTELTATTPASFYQSAPSQANSGDHVFSAWFYTDNKALLDDGAYMEVSYYNGGTWVASKAVQLLPLLVNNSWVFVSATLPAPATGHTAVRGNVAIKRNGRLWMSQPQLQKGKNPSTFMENPKDYANYDQLVGEIAKKVATSDFNSKVTQMETTINQQSSRIDLKAEKNDVYTKIDSDGRYGSKAIVDNHTSQLSVMTTEINLRVKNNEIASTINQTAQSVLIQASKIYLDGYIEAKHLKANKLVGVTIETEPQVFANAKLHLNRQNLTIVHGNTARGYLGFIDRTDANYQPMIQIGGAYAKGVSSSVEGSMIMSVIEDYNGSAILGVIGMAKSMSGNDISYYNSLTFNPLDKTLKIASESDSEYKVTDGNIDIKANSSRSIAGFANIEATRTVTLTSNSGRINFNQSSGSNRASIEFSNTYYTDFNLGAIKLRYSSHPDDNGKGLHLVEGGALGNMKLNILRADGNISSQGTVYAVAFQPTSSRKIKTNFADLPFSALQKVNSVNIKQYNFIKDVEEYNGGFRDKVETYYGMIAEDVDQVFASPERDSVNLYNIASISMQAIQEVDWKVNNLQFDIGMLKQELEAQKLKEVDQDNRIAALEELVRKLMNETPTTENTTQPEQP